PFPSPCPPRATLLPYTTLFRSGPGPACREPGMSLTPETRVLLTHALRPPAGHHVATAVGTTYSLDLTALLLAPMSFALFDQYDQIGRATSELQSRFDLVCRLLL